MPVSSTVLLEKELTAAQKVHSGHLGVFNTSHVTGIWKQARKKALFFYVSCYKGAF